MGVKKLFDVIRRKSPESITIHNIYDFKDKVLLIDGALMIYKNIMAIRKNGYDIMNGNKSITHIHSMLNKLKKFKELNITPIFVFDGVVPKLKIKTLEERERVKQVMQAKYREAKTKEDKARYYYLKSDITNQEIEESIKLIKTFNYCVLYAEEEADQLLATLSQNPEVDAVVTDDMDILVFGGKNILKDFSVDPTRKFYKIDLLRFKKDAKLNQDKLIILALLLGTDYSVNVPNVGPVKAPELIKKYKTIDGLYNTGILNKSMRKNFIQSFNIFKKTYLIKDYDLNGLCKLDDSGAINYNQLESLLKEFNYKTSTINKLFEELTKIDNNKNVNKNTNKK